MNVFKLLILPLIVFAGGISNGDSRANTCPLPIEQLDPLIIFPKQVRQKYCNPDTGYNSLLLIEAAINEDEPVYRIITVQQVGADTPKSVKLYQFDKAGNDHTEVKGETQAIIDFQKNDLKFDARVKGRKTTLTFAEGQFKFNMGGLFGLKIDRPYDSNGRILVNDQPVSALLIRSTRKSHWNWVSDNGELMPFSQ